MPRLESWLKVTGRAEYVHNLRLPGMLYGKIFRSTVAHGRIKRIDTAAAQALAGVYRVITAQEVKSVVPEPYYGPAFHDQPILALDKVRYVGEPVAVVLASDPHVAEEAVHLITAEYEELPAVYDEVEAMTSKAIVHDALKPAGTFPDLKHLKGRANTNVALDFHLRKGGNAGEDEDGRTRLRAPLPHAAGDAHPARAPGVGGGVDRKLAYHPYRFAEPVVRAHRDRAPSAGRRTAFACACRFSAAASARSSISSWRPW